MNRLLISGALLIVAGTSYSATIKVPDTDQFEKQVASINKCYLEQKTNCDGQDMSSLYWSDDPSSDYDSITSTAPSAPVPSSNTYSNNSSNYSNTNKQSSSAVVNDDSNNSSDNDSTDDNSNGFVIS